MGASAVLRPKYGSMGATFLLCNRPRLGPYYLGSYCVSFHGTDFTSALLPPPSPLSAINTVVVKGAHQHQRKKLSILWPLVASAPRSVVVAAAVCGCHWFALVGACALMSALQCWAKMERPYLCSSVLDPQLRWRETRWSVSLLCDEKRP